MATKKLASTMRQPEATIYETQEFRNVIMLHMDMILTRSGNSSITINQHEADKWRGDFYGLLSSKGVRPHMFWLLTVMNGLTNSGDYNADFLEIIIPDIDYIEMLRDIHNTTHL